MSGEQFALDGAIERLREIRRTPADGACLVISAADPLNLAGIVTAGDKVRAVAPTRIAYRDGVPVAAMEGDYVRPLIALTDVAPAVAAEVATTLAGRPVRGGAQWFCREVMMRQIIVAAALTLVCALPLACPGQESRPQAAGQDHLVERVRRPGRKNSRSVHARRRHRG